MTDATRLISLQNVTIEIGNRTILQNVSLDIYGGQCVALMGHSGCGKSTLLRVLAGLLNPTRGSTYYKDHILSNISFVFQEPNLLSWLTIMENVTLPLKKFSDMTASVSYSKGIKVLQRVGLDGFEDHYPHEISGGMRQRASFARALVVESDILFLDEPFSSLDMLTTTTILSELQNWYTGSMIMVTHSLDEAVSLADKVVLIDNTMHTISHRITIPFPRPRKLNELHLTSCKNQILKSFVSLEDVKEEDWRFPHSEFSVLLGLLLETQRKPQGILIEDLPITAQSSVRSDVAVVLAGQWFGWASITSNRVMITRAGNEFLGLNNKERSEIIAQHLRNNVPLTSHILKWLAGNYHSMSYAVLKDNIMAEFESIPSDDRMLGYMRWATVAKLFTYNNKSQIVSRL